MSTVLGTVIGLSMLTAGAFYTAYKAFQTEINKNTNQTDPVIIDPNGAAVQFVLFTRNNTPYNIQPRRYGDLMASGFNPDLPIKIITHGFLSSIIFNVFTLIKDENYDYNIIGMDWSALSKSEYLSAMHGAKLAGQELANFINWLAINGVALNNIHLIGHSLGAHVAGVGGDGVKGGRVARITGLDPAGPGYNGDIEEKLKLDQNDALLVDVVHTYLRVIGTPKPLGHVDFYPNGGLDQPGCPDLITLKVTDSILCNHGRAFELFAEAVRNPNAFKCKRCDSLENAWRGKCFDENEVYMGQEKSYKNGLYYFKTTGEPPYIIL